MLFLRQIKKALTIQIDRRNWLKQLGVGLSDIGLANFNTLVFGELQARLLSKTEQQQHYWHKNL